ncbi:MAG TPA: hypothetical protein VFH66_06605 [Mycobacteriales bacterium]|nr:hypothetical protein [Mycobacteriales bacterium]
MAKYKFTATHGVTFSDQPDGGDLQTWAAFTEDREAMKPTGERVYTFETDDAKVADRLRKVDDYGITEVDGGEGGYSKQKVADLQAEIDRRNEGRDEADQIAPEGEKKADLIAALEADDEAQG